MPTFLVTTDWRLGNGGLTNYAPFVTELMVPDREESTEPSKWALTRLSRLLSPCTLTKIMDCSSCIPEPSSPEAKTMPVTNFTSRTDAKCCANLGTINRSVYYYWLVVDLGMREYIDVRILVQPWLKIEDRAVDQLKRLNHGSVKLNSGIVLVASDATYLTISYSYPTPIFT